MKRVFNKNASRRTREGGFSLIELIMLMGFIGMMGAFAITLATTDHRQKTKVQSLTQRWESQGSVLTSDEHAVVGSHFEGSDRTLVWKEAKTAHYLLVSTLAAAGCRAGVFADDISTEELNTLVPPIEALQDHPATAAHAKTISFDSLSQQDRALCPELKDIDGKASYQGRIVALVDVRK